MNISKLSNAFFEDAQLSAVTNMVTGSSVDKFKKIHSGLWVGGKVRVNKTELRFDVNFVNQAVHKELAKILIPIIDIESCRYEFAWLTGIVVIIHKNGTFRFRCYGAKKVANEIRQTIQGL